MTETAKRSYFVEDKSFYKDLFRIMVVTAMMNLINYGVNMADNIMLGSYGQTELSAAAVVNQIFFMLTAFVANFGSCFSVLAAQYWGKKNQKAICWLGGLCFKLNISVAIIFFILCTVIPKQLIGIFTSNAAIIATGAEYLKILKFIFIPYAISMLIMDMLRCVETVNISFYMSIVSLIINVSLNYLFIFGNLGCPEMGITGAAVATLIARIVEVCVLLFYLAKKDKKLRFFKSDFYKNVPELTKAYFKIAIAVMPTGVAWYVATPVQTALLGHLTADAIAANSVSTTFYQLLKVVSQAMNAGTGIVIGKNVGKGDFDTVKAGARTVELIALGIGFCLGVLLFACRPLIISFYSLTPEAESLSKTFLLIMSVVIIGMSYEVTLLSGVIRASGGTRFAALANFICLWCISMPLAFAAVFWWHLSAVWVVIFVQSEQIIKCIPTFIRIRQPEKWIKVLAK